MNPYEQYRGISEEQMQTFRQYLDERLTQCTSYVGTMDGTWVTIGSPIEGETTTSGTIDTTGFSLVEDCSSELLEEGEESEDDGVCDCPLCRDDPESEYNQRHNSQEGALFTIAKDAEVEEDYLL